VGYYVHLLKSAGKEVCGGHSGTLMAGCWGERIVAEAVMAACEPAGVVLQLDGSCVVLC
jgi:hypothetical protein